MSGKSPSQWTTFAEATKRNGCTCVPLYSIVLRHEGQLVRESVGHNRKEAERALDARRGDVARHTYRVVQDIRFDEWGDQWLAGFTGKDSSRMVYAHTIGYAKKAFGKVKVREITPTDVGRLLNLIRQAHLKRQLVKAGEEPRPVSQATLAKHLRQLGACLEAAIAEGYANENAVRKLHRTKRPRVEKSRPAYYTDAELAWLWPELAFRPAMLALCKTAVATGARIGELAALRWGDVDLLNREIHISRSYVDRLGERSSTKSGEPRTIDLTPQATELLEGWYTESGGGDGLLFKREEGGHLTPGYVLTRILYPALERAGVPRIGERGRKRDFHSFRHTFARVALESGAEITWVQKQLGHSSITLTVDTYGAWARAAEKSQAAKLAGVFPV